MQPGESGKIPIKISTKKGSGPLSKSITVNTNIEGADATLRLTIKGEVWQPVQVTPQSAAFGRLTAVKASSEMERKLTIVNNIDGELTLSNIRSSNPRFKAEVRPLEPGKKFELIVTMVPPLQDGNNTGKITIDTGLEEPATLDVPVYAFVTAPVDVTPAQLTLLPNRTASMKRQLYIRSHDNKAFEVKNLKCTTDALTLDISDMRGNQQTYQLVVEIPVDYAPGPNGDKITFDTTHPAQPSMTIPISMKGVGSRARVNNRIKPTTVAPAGKFTGRIVPQAPTNVTKKADGAGKPDESKQPSEPAKPEAPKKAAPMNPVGQ